MAPVIASSGGFQRIGKGIYLFSRPTEVSIEPLSTATSQSPNLILTFGWMGAKLPHLLKYTAVHRELYPDATNILIQCEPSFFISRESTCRANLEPVLDVLKSLNYLPVSNTEVEIAKVVPPRLLIHAFSNGGCSQLTCLRRLLKDRYPNWDVLKRGSCALVLDSCPGVGNLGHAQRAMGALVGQPILRPLLGALITWLYIYSAITKRLFGWANPLEILKRDLNRYDLLPWTHKSTPRLYLASKADNVVAFYEVEGHVESAKKAGFEDVRFEIFEETPHVSHAKFEPERYWGAVKAVCDSARRHLD